MLSNETNSNKLQDFNVITPGNLSEITKVFGIYMEQIKIYALKDSKFYFFF